MAEMAGNFPEPGSGAFSGQHSALSFLTKVRGVPSG